jgi:hypothetical protein
MAAKFRKVDVTEVDSSNKVVIVSDSERYLLKRGSTEDSRWRLWTMHNKIAGIWRHDAVIDISAYSNDIIVKIQLDMY